MNIINQQNKNKIAGFTLVEILVALVISSILMLGVIQVFSSSKRNNKVNEAISRVQENARFAMQAIVSDFRKAGYVGCNPDNLKNFLDTSDPSFNDLYNLNAPTGGWEYTASSTKPATTSLVSPYIIPTPFSVTTPAANDWLAAGGGNLPASLTNRVAAGSDVVVLKWAEPMKGVTGKGSNNITNTTASTTAAHSVPQGGIVMLSNCRGGDIFMNVSSSKTQLTRGAAVGWVPGNINPSNNWTQAWKANTQIMQVQSHAYFIGQGTGGGPALYRAIYSDGLTGSSGTLVTYEELAEGIESLQVLYAIDTDADNIIDSYDTAENISHAQVVGLQVGIIASSDANSLATAKARTLNVIGTFIQTPNDRRLRYVFSSTTKLRNKGVK